MRKLIPIIAMSLVTSGCAITTMEARIDPQPQVQQSTVGQGKNVGVVVVDERPTRDLGKRSSVGGAIRMNQDLAVIYQTAILKGLAAKGFTAQGGAISNGANIKVELRGLNQVSTTGLWTMGTEIDAAMKVIATNGVKTYEQMYRAGDSHRTLAVSDAKSLNTKLNAVVSSQIETMFNDQMLMSNLIGN